MDAALDSLLSGPNAIYIAELYERWQADPRSVDDRWAAFFDDLKGEPPGGAELHGPSWRGRDLKVVGGEDPDGPTSRPADSGRRAADGERLSPQEARQRTLDSIRALMMIRAYRVRGHLHAKLDPLGIQHYGEHSELDYRSYGFTEADLDREIFIDHVLGLEQAPLRQIVEVVRDTYCGTIGVEFMHIQYPEQKAWIQQRIEGIRNQTDFTPEGKRAILERLIEAEDFETFLGRKYTGTKRFGLEGGEALLAAVEQILKRGGQLGLSDVVIGMAHRGRLNMLANVMHKPFQAIFSEFEGNTSSPDDVQGSGDVKYHLGTSADRTFDDKTIHLSLVANPSHLEVVDPVVLGKVRAKQMQLVPKAERWRIGDPERRSVLGLLLHGDAAFAGQGIVAECFGFSQTLGYRTGGTIHFIINNQIGFTTSPRHARSGTYASDMAKVIQAPILHVNGDDAEAVVHAARIAIEFRQEFQSDVVIDMVCYRRQGHNESDEPAFTQPIMYKSIANHPTTRHIYARRLIEEGALSEDEVEAMAQSFHDKLEAAFKATASYKPNRGEWLQGMWQGYKAAMGEEEYRQEPTRVDADTLRRVGKVLTTPPEGFDLNRKIVRQLKAKAAMFDSGEGFDWATGEAMALGTLLREGHPVRLSGQDVGRGTFSQRHAVLVDQTTEERFRPLNTLSSDQAVFEVHDSPLSEVSILGFEYGYSLQDPDALVMWEAQFGDFANGAQVIIDQFISAAESKWLRMSGLVLLLPHGYEGQGPEHSSARPERFLQLCAEDNIQVCNISTPANYFHFLRRQVKRNYRKPAILMSPKSLLRHKLCVSTLADFTDADFQRAIPEADPLTKADKVRRVVLCTGKVYYDLLETRRAKELDDVALIRVEQFYPWPKDTLMNLISAYPKAEVVWCQEEPANMGYWTFVDRRLQYLLEEINHPHRQAFYAGRRAAASPATGSFKTHQAEQAKLVGDALTTPLDKIPQPFHRVTELARIGH
ncbi:2-oxoglutarate dehydrogenase E1 component [Roseospirillum parvum]|uniref:2-oxoglutarate dehydrogenase E1 component n=1 Tax=Roseospirillum parvum TaxID=83401 RepID=A0A1G8AUQ9_9PROT|nr:2-oxoglutarate dehydrogenase E1 component [Roseospirillum parvum]SDH24553.1 2-oxoglutarate dehydrogenase E1 component [Roseospirillum parvum]